VQSKVIRVAEPSSNAFNGSPITPSAVIDALHGNKNENSRQLAIIDMVEGNGSAVLSSLTIDQQIVSRKTVEMGVEDQCKALVSYPTITINTVDKTFSLAGLDCVKHQMMIKVEPQCFSLPSSFLKPGCIKTHL